MRYFLWVRCTGCKREGQITYKGGSSVPDDKTVESNRNKWSCRGCNFCKTPGSLRLYKNGRERPITRHRKNKGVSFGPIRPTRVRLSLVRSEFTSFDDLVEELGPEDSEEDVEDAADEDGEYFEEAGGHYTGTIGRLNTIPYPHADFFSAPPGINLAGLKSHCLQNGARVGAKTEARGSQQGVMSAHYDTVGVQNRKTYVASVLYTHKGKRVPLSATKFANLFLCQDINQVFLFLGTTKHSSMEWCHALACSLGGSGAYNNLFAGSYDSNTFSACLEGWLGKHRNDLSLYVWVNVCYQGHNGNYAQWRSSCRRAPLFFTYCIANNPHAINSAGANRSMTFYVDCRCIGFNRANYDDVRNRLNVGFSIPMERR